MIRNPIGMDADRELHGRIYAFSDHKAVLATHKVVRIQSCLVKILYDKGTALNSWSITLSLLIPLASASKLKIKRWRKQS
jgi:hypothetical protein